MKFGLQKLIVTVLLISVLSNVTSSEIYTFGYYFSSEFKEGAILKWNREVNHKLPEPAEISMDYFEVTILQDITNTSMGYDNMYEFFSISKNGEVYSDSIVNRTLSYFIYPIILVIHDISYPLYEYFQMIKEEVFPDLQFERKLGNIIIINNQTLKDGFYFSDIKIHEETGIVRKSTTQLVEDGNVWITNIEYKGGVSLVRGEFRIVIFVLIGIPLVYIKNQRKRKKNQPP